MSNTIYNKAGVDARFAGLAPVASSGSYADLTDKPVLTPVTADVTPAAGTVAGELIGFRNTSAAAKTIAGFAVAAGGGVILEWTGTSWARAADLPALTTTAPPVGDTTAPAWSATVTVGTPTQTSVVASVSALATDAVGVTGYEVSYNGGTSWAAITPSGMNFTLTGTAGTAYATTRLRAKDAAGNLSAALSVPSYTMTAAVAPQAAHVWAFGQPDGPITAAVPSDDAALSLIPGDTTGLWVYAAGKLSSKTTTPGTVTWATARDSWTLQVDYSVASNMSCIYGGRSANGGAAGRVYHGVQIAGTSLAWIVGNGSALAKSDTATYTVPLAATLKLVTTKTDATHWTMEASINGTVIATCTFTATLAAYAYQGDSAHIMPGGNTTTACTADNLTLTV